MQGLTASPDNGASRSAGNDEAANKGWFKHFSEGSEERERIKLSLTLFSITLVLCAIGLWVGHHQQRKQYDWRIRHAEQGLPLQLKDIKEQKYSSEALREKGKNIYENFRDREYDAGGDEERRILDALIEKYLRPVTLADFDETQLRSQIVDYFRPITLKDHAILFYQPILIVWLIFGVVYWLVIFALYSSGLNPGVGEPTFNIIDVGFLAVLIQYTGGLSNFFLLTYLFSLLLASFDFFFRKDYDAYKNKRFPTRLFIILGPYVFSFILSVFWATYERVFSREDNWEQYLLVWLLLVVCAGLIWIAFYRAIKYHYTRNPLQASQASM